MPTPRDAQPAPLPTFELAIRVRRDLHRLEVGEAEIVFGHWRLDEKRPRQVRWLVHGGLLPDELVIIFGKPLDWSQPNRGGDPAMPLVEDIFSAPFVLNRRGNQVTSGVPRFDYPEGPEVVAWNYGVVLIRGHDTPWITDSLLRIRRVRRP